MSSEQVMDLIEKGRQKLEDGKPDEAMRYLNKALELEPKNYDLHFLKGLAFYGLEEDKNALNSFDQTLNLNENHFWAYYYKSSILNDSEKYDLALEFIDKALVLEPENVDALILKGLELSNSDRKSIALGYFEDALKIDPNYFDALKFKGITLYNFDKFEEAVDSLKMALAIEPDEEYLLMFLADSLSSLEEYGDAIEIYDKVLDINPDNSLVLYLKAQSLWYIDETEEAMNSVNESLKIDPKFTLSIILKADLYRDLERYEDAIKCYKKAFKINPNNPDPWVGIGNVYKDLDNKKEAIEAYEKFVEIIRKNKISDKNFEAHRVMEYVNWLKKGESITFSPKDKPQYWQWCTRPEYFLEDEGSERKWLEPTTASHDPGTYWTCHKDTLAGDLILLYRAGTHNGIEYKDIKYLIMARSDAYPLDDIKMAVEKKWDYGCDYIPIFKFENSLKLSEMQEDPYLEGWNALNALFSMKAYSTKEKYWKHLMNVLREKNPDFADFWNKFDRKKVIANIKTEKDLEDELEKKIHVLNKFGYDLEVVDRQKICRGDAGRIDLLCKDNNSDDYVVIELKIDRANRNVFGQISGYMGWVMDHKANSEAVKGIVISRGYDKKFQSALKTNPNIDHIELGDVLSELGMKLK